MKAVLNNYAFISYSHQDSKIAKWLQHKLEQYYIPTKIYEKVRPENLPKNGSHYLRPIFLDKTDLNGGILADTLKQNLESSRYLIVICSPNSAKSEWVSKEVQSFIESGRLDYIIPFVIKGTPFLDSQIAAGKNPEGEECMPKYLVDFTKRHPDKELLGIDLNENGLEGSALRIISLMLGISFDDLWNRQARRNRARISAFFAAIAIIFAVASFFFLPVQLTYTITNLDQVAGLPLPDDATLTIEGTTYNLGSQLDTTIVLKSRPGYYRGTSLPVEFYATYFDTIRTEIEVGYGFSKSETLYISRNNMFAVFAGRVIDQDGEPLSGAKVSVRQISSTTNSEGVFKIVLPQSEQAEEQAILIEKFGYHDVYRPDEIASEDLTYIMHKIE